LEGGGLKWRPKVLPGVTGFTLWNFEVIENFYWQSVSTADVDKARVLLELLFVQLGNFHLFDFDTQALIVCLCTD